MSLLAGIVARRAGPGIRPEDRDALERLLARDATLPRRVFGSDAYHLVHADWGSHGSPGTVSSPEAISLLAGDPVLDGPHSRATRADELAALHEAWRRGDDALLPHARGTFALVHVGRAQVCLVSDRIGLRPLYLWVDDDRVVFSSSLRVLEELPSVPKRVDLQGASEILVFGYPLTDRTPYAGIRRLPGGLRVVIDGPRIEETRYWRPEEVRTSPKPLEALERDAYEAFREGVRLRQRGDRSCVALLSGGLDSRCVVSALRDAGADVSTFGFSYGDEQDHVFSRQFAEAVGTTHRRFLLKPGAKPDWGHLARQALDSTPGGLAGRVDRPDFLWTGDNGSFTVGFVHMSEEIFAHLRAGRETDALEAYLRMYGRLPRGVFRPGVAARLESLAREGLAEQFKGIRCDDPAKRAYVFYLMTEARHILSGYFEEMDRHRLDTPVPFCDGRLLEGMLSIPMDVGLRHEFYHRLLSHFPPVTTSVPWQTYPGHLPCPLASGTDARPQWQPSSRDYDRSVREHATSIASRLLHGAPFPDRLVRKGRLRLARWAHGVGLRQLGYVFQVVATLQRIYAVAEGRLDRDPVGT